MRIVVIGGNAAGMTAASRAKRVDPRLDITVLEKSPFISYSTCGLPYFISDEVSSDDLVRFTPARLRTERGIEALVDVQVDAVLPSRKLVTGHRTNTGESVSCSFDRLLLATGVSASVPDIPGASLQNVFSLNSLADALDARPSMENAHRVAIVGGGYVGLEMAEALRKTGKTVSIFERNSHVLTSVDPDMSRVIEYELLRHGVELRLGTPVDALVGEDTRVIGVKTRSTLGVSPAEAVLLDTGVTPNVELCEGADIHVGEAGGIAVNEYMETNVPSVFAAGNCAEAFCLLRRRPVLHHIGTVAAKQGRIAGENLAGKRSTFSGTVGTTILKVFDLAVGRAGYSSDEAAAERVKAVSVRIEALDKASYLPGSRKIWIKLIANRENGMLIGAQSVGYGDVSKRIDVAATAITSSMTIEELSQLDLSYTPPYGSLWDPLLVAAQALLRQL
jgi:NADPH-dependent 2,4-dienoyl-CoA reductase/sulfur reductase-like enzyme